MRHQKIDFKWPEDRDVREALMMGFLKQLKLTPPETIGNLDEGFPEITANTDLYWNGSFFADIECLVQWKRGAAPIPFVMRSNVGGPGDIFLPVMDGKIALVTQPRSPLGKRTWEVPRGFSSEWKESSGKKLGAKAIPEKFGNALKELSEEVGQASDVVPTFLAYIAENSGTTTTSPAYWLLRIGKIKLGGTDEGINVKLVSIEEAYDMIGTQIADSHSITALALAQKHLAIGLLRLDIKLRRLHYPSIAPPQRCVFRKGPPP